MSGAAERSVRKKVCLFDEHGFGCAVLSLRGVFPSNKQTNKYEFVCFDMRSQWNREYMS